MLLPGQRRLGHQCRGLVRETRRPILSGSTVDSVQSFCESGAMYQAAITEFPFVEELPRREKSKLAKLWDHLAAVRAITAEKGTLIPQHMAAGLLNVCKQRVCQLIDDGKLEGIEVHGVRYVTADSCEAWAKAERSKGGRPRKVVDNRALWKASWEAGQDIVEKSSKNC